MKNQPAFPCEYEAYSPLRNGMTLRDYFAAKAMQGLMSGRWKTDVHGHQYDAYRSDADEWAKSAYHFADAMLKARGE